MRSTWRRRAVLHGVVGLASGLAGCFSDSNGDGESPDSNGFDDVRVKDTMLVVELAAGAAIDRVNVIAPDGTAFAGKDVQQGVTTVEFDIGVAYQAGEHRIVGVADGQTVAETTLDITPNVTITEVGIGANHLDRMPDALGETKSAEALVSLENTGNGPEAIEKLLFLGDVPNPTVDIKNTDDNGDVSGILDVDDGAGEIDFFVLTSGETTTIYSNTLPFSFEGDGVDCEPEKQMGEFEVTIVTRVNENVSQSYKIEYSASEKYNQCEINISEEGS